MINFNYNLIIFPFKENNFHLIKNLNYFSNHNLINFNIIKYLISKLNINNNLIQIKKINIILIKHQYLIPVPLNKIIKFKNSTFYILKTNKLN